MRSDHSSDATILESNVGCTVVSARDDHLELVGLKENFIRVMRKWFPTRSDTNWVLQPKRIARGLKFSI